MDLRIHIPIFGTSRLSLLFCWHKPDRLSRIDCWKVEHHVNVSASIDIYKVTFLQHIDALECVDISRMIQSRPDGTP